MEGPEEPTEQQFAEPENLIDPSQSVDETGTESELSEGVPNADEAIGDEADVEDVQAEQVAEADQSEEDEHSDDEDPVQKRPVVFISYNHNANDTNVAARIDEELRQHYEVFIDQRLEPGVVFADVAQDWLRRADFIIALISPQSLTSHWVTAELEDAFERSKTEGRPSVIPVRIDYEGPYSLIFRAYIGRFHAIYWDNQNYAWLFERLHTGLSRKLAPPSKPVIAGTDIILFDDTLRARYAETFVEPRELVNSPASFEEKRLLWLTGDATLTNYVALSLAAQTKSKSLYEITKQRKWSEINNTLVSDSTIVLRDALPAPYLNESGAVAEWHSLRAIIERNNIIIATAPDDEFEKLQQELLRYQFTDYQHRHVDTDSYTDDSKLLIFSRLVDHLFETGELDEDKYAWAADLAKDPNEAVIASGQGRARAIERRRRDMRRKFRENIGRWSPADIVRFVLSLSQVRGESGIARLLQRAAAIEDEIRSWFLSLDDSTQCFVMTVALFSNLDHEDLWGRYKTIVEHLRQFDASLRLLPFGICRKRAHPYVSLDGRIELDERVADPIRQEIARSYREYFIELTPRLKEWSVPAGRNPKTVEQRNQRKPQIEKTKEARRAIARMVGIVARLGLDDLVDILDYWATDSNIQIRKSVAFAFEQTAKSPTGVNYALNLLEKWSLDINSNGQLRWRALAAAHALGYVTAAANDAYVTVRALNCLRTFARSRRPDSRFYASIAMRDVARYAPLSSTEGTLSRLAKDDRIEVRVNVAAALNGARGYDSEAADALIERWVLSDDPNRRWVALCGIVTSRWSQNGASPNKYERLLGFLANEESALSLASVLGETVTDDHYGQVARDTFSYLARETKEQAWNNLAAGLGAVPIGKLEKELLPLLHFDTAPLFSERAIEVRREVLKTKLDDPPHFLSILKSWLSREHVRLEVFRALTMLLDESAAGNRPRFIAAMAEYFAHNALGVNEMLSTLEALAPAHFASISRAVSREAFRRLLQDPTRLLSLSQKQLTDEATSVATQDALDALACDDPPGAREQLLRALLDGYVQVPDAARNLLSTLKSTGSTDLLSTVREFNYRLIEGAMSSPAEFPELVLDMVHRDAETFSLLNYLAAPEPQGQRSRLVRAFVEARLLEINAAEVFLALPALKEWLNLASIPAEVARSFYVRRIFSAKFVRRLFVRRS